MDEEESEIRQTDLAVMGERKSVWLVWGDGKLDTNSQEATVDKLGRVYLPIEVLGNGQRRKLKAISFTGERHAAIPVHHIEPRYEDEHLKYLVCTLRRLPNGI